MPTSEEIAAEILDVVPAIMQAIRVEMRGHRDSRLSVPQFRALAFLSSRPGSSLAELAEHIGLTPPSASSLVDGLVTTGLLQRVEAAPDRRRVALRLTDAGQSLLESAVQGARAGLAERLAGLTDEQRQLVHQAFQALRPLYD